MIEVATQKVYRSKGVDWNEVCRKNQRTKDSKDPEEKKKEEENVYDEYIKQ